MRGSIFFLNGRGGRGSKPIFCDLTLLNSIRLQTLVFLSRSTPTGYYILTIFKKNQIQTDFNSQHINYLSFVL